MNSAAPGPKGGEKGGSLVGGTGGHPQTAAERRVIEWAPNEEPGLPEIPDESGWIDAGGDPRHDEVRVALEGTEPELLEAGAQPLPARHHLRHVRLDPVGLIEEAGGGRQGEGVDIVQGLHLGNLTQVLRRADQIAEAESRKSPPFRKGARNQ